MKLAHVVSYVVAAMVLITIYEVFCRMVLVPIGTLLLFLQALARIIRNILFLKTGVDEVAKAQSRYEFE